jgi:hypothetical protein
MRLQAQLEMSQAFTKIQRLNKAALKGRPGSTWENSSCQTILTVKYTVQWTARLITEPYFSTRRVMLQHE